MGSILFLCFAFLTIIGLPIAVVLGVSSVIALAVGTNTPLLVVAQRMYTATASFPLLAIPFFMIAGALMEGGGISRRLINMTNKMVGSFTGGLAMVAIITCMFFAAISGSGPATVAAISSIMIPAMVAAGYDLGFASAIMAAAGSIGIVIPPSIPMVTYGVVGSVSIGSLFLGGFGAGIIVGLSLMVTAYVIAKKRGYKGEGLKIKDLGRLLSNAAVSTSVVMLIISTASIFGWIMTSQRIPDAVAQAFINFSDSKYVILMLINVLLLVIGCFMETNAAIIILAPIFLPLLMKLGVDPIHKEDLDQLILQPRIKAWARERLLLS